MKMALITTLLKLGIELGINKQSSPRFIILKIILSLFILIGGLFLVIALYQLLNLYYGSLLANVFFGVGFILAAMIISIVIRKKQQAAQQFNVLNNWQEISQPLRDSAQQAGEKVKATAAQHQGKILLGLFLAGLFLGRQQAKKSHASKEH